MAASISVVMVSYRTGPVLFAAIESALGQPELQDLVLVDNGNDPATLRRLLDLAAAEPRLRILTGHGNIGFAAGCNLGAAEAGGDYLLLMNPDCLAPPGVFGELMAELVRDSDAWVVTPALVGPDGRRRRGTPRNILTPWLAVVEALRRDRLAPRHPYFRRLNLHETVGGRVSVPVPAASGAFLLMARDVYERLGGMDEGYFLHVEDLDFCVRMSRAGGKLVFAPQVAVLHHEGTSRAALPFIEWHKAWGFRRYFHRHFATEYPPSFLRLATVLAFLQFALRSVAWVLTPWRWRRHRRGMARAAAKASGRAGAGADAG